jgi:co-chaperonin GroES (HSP10)
MKLRPLGPYIIVKPVKYTATEASGIIIPDVAEEMKQRAEVVLVPEGVELDITPGDHVFFAGWAGTTFRYGKQLYMALKAEEIICAVEDARVTKEPLPA